MIKTADGKRGLRLPVVILLMLVSAAVGGAAGTLGLLWATGGLSTPSREASEVAEPLAVDENAAGALDATLYQITEDESEARFLIDESFFGEDITVVGTTGRMAGEVLINFATPGDSQLGEIAVNVRTLKTDQEFRDQSIRGQILESSKDEYEFVTFAPTALQNMPEDAVSVGDTVGFQIVGDLTIKDTTNEVTFDATVTIEAEDRITGLATTEVLYADYGLTINPPPNIANIGDTVGLEIDFVALAASDDSEPQEADATEAAG